MATRILPATRAPATAPASSRPARALVPGVAAAAGLGIVATVIGRSVPLAGSALPAAVLGLLIAIAVRRGRSAGGRRLARYACRFIGQAPGGSEGRSAGGRWPARYACRFIGRAPGGTGGRSPGRQQRFAPGLKFASSRLLQCSVVLLGAQLPAADAVRVGVSSLPVMAGTLVACLGAAWLYGRMLGVTGDVRTLIGVGTGICGASAIAAASPVIEAASADIAYAVSTIFVFNLAAVLVFPLAGHALGMSQGSFGLFAGTAVNDTSSVVATATTYGPQAASQAVVVKLVRTLMIIPVCAGLAALTARRKPTGAVTNRLSVGQIVRLIPWFLAGFLVMAGVNSAGLIPGSAHGPVSAVAAFLVAVALSAIGLSTDVAALKRAGLRPLALGALLWITVAAASLGLQALTGTLH